MKTKGYPDSEVFLNHVAPLHHLWYIQPPAMLCEKLFLRISPSRIWYLKFILEGYDGLATLSTIDQEKGIVLLRFPESSQKILVALLERLAPALLP